MDKKTIIIGLLLVIIGGLIGYLIRFAGIGNNPSSVSTQPPAQSSVQQNSATQIPSQENPAVLQSTIPATAPMPSEPKAVKPPYSDWKPPAHTPENS